MTVNAASLVPNFWNNPYQYYTWTLTISDKYTKGWLLVDSPMPTLILTSLYLLMVWLGPKFMKNRKPLQLVWFLVPYNLAMAALNFFISLELLINTTKLGYNFYCEPVHERNSPNDIRLRRALWWYYFSKLLEFTDTFCFIVRKKDNQLSFLHVYHHTTMFMFWWIGIKWVPSGSSFFPALINSLIHVLMYTYYGLAALGPQMNKYLWWKKYLTIIQLIQFNMVLFCSVASLVKGCDYPLWMKYTMIGYMLSFLVLFGRFYATSYCNNSGLKLGQIESKTN